MTNGVLRELLMEYQTNAIGYRPSLEWAEGLIAHLLRAALYFDSYALTNFDRKLVAERSGFTVKSAPCHILIVTDYEPALSENERKALLQVLERFAGILKPRPCGAGGVT